MAGAATGTRFRTGWGDAWGESTAIHSLSVAESSFSHFSLRAGFFFFTLAGRRGKCPWASKEHMPGVQAHRQQQEPVTAHCGPLLEHYPSDTLAERKPTQNRQQGHDITAPASTIAALDNRHVHMSINNLEPIDPSNSP